MDRLTPSAEDLLDRYRQAQPGEGAARRNFAAVQKRVRRRPRKAGWGYQVAWGLAAAAAAALVLLLVDRVLPEAGTTSSIENAEPQQALDRALGQADGGTAKHRRPSAARDGANVEPPVVEPAAAPPETVGAAGADTPSRPHVGGSQGANRAPDRSPASARADPQPAGDPASESPHAEANGSSVDALAEETRLLARARASIQSGALGAAASAVATHRKRFPNGALAEDRDAYGVLIACKRGDANAAKLRREFAGAYPRSPHVPRITEACGARSIP